MGLDIPNLDEKNFETLLEEAKSKLPSLAPKWTEYNLSDPGITLIELFAWLSDINYYRLNRIDPQHEEAFLKIAGLEKGVYKPSNVLLNFTSWLHIAPYDKDNGVDDLDLSKRILVPQATEVFTNNIRFITQKDLWVYPVNFDISALYVKGFGEEKEVRKDDFYPFSKELFNGFYFSIEFTHKISKTLTLYILTSEYSDEVVNISALQWMYFDEDNDIWVDTVVEDTTNNFTKSSEVTITLPVKTSKIKCVLIDTSFYETPPLIQKIFISAVMVKQETQNEYFLGESSGYVNQSFALEKIPDDGSLEVKVGRDIWSRVDTLQHTSPNEKVYMLDNSKIVFGDGAHGEVPRRSLDISCRYVSNCGSRANVAQESDWVCEKIKSYKTDMIVENYFEGWGGEDPKSTQEVLQDFQNSLKIPTRAVSLKDYEYLALHTPYTHLVKAKAFADQETNHVSVIVIPISENKRPQVNEYTRVKVLNFLNTKRLLTTKVSVLKAKYQSVLVDVSVFSQKYDPQELQGRISSVLDGYLHPLTGGKESKGWEFGENLYLWELYKIIAAIEGVESIEQLQINKSTQSVVDVAIDTLISAGKYTIKIKGPNPLACRGGL